MVRYVAIWYDVLICMYIFESSMAKWCILTLFETYAGPASASVIYEIISTCRSTVQSSTLQRKKLIKGGNCILAM